MSCKMVPSKWKSFYNIAYVLCTHQNLYITLLIVTTILFEASSSLVMNVISSFYQVISKKDYSSFVNCLFQSIFVMIIISCFKTIQMILQEVCSIKWRKFLVDFIQTKYVNNASILMYQYNLDNLDERITQDINLFTSQFTSFCVRILCLPFVIIYYTVVLWDILGWLGPTCCYIYFFVGFMVSSRFMKAIVPLAYKRECLEGNFRYSHVQFRNFVDTIYLLQGDEVESARMSNSFDKLFQNTIEIIYAHIPLYVTTNLFSYFGSIVNYTIVGICIMSYSNINSSDSEADNASLLAKGSYACLYLIASFSTIVESFDILSELLALAIRIDEISISLVDASNNNPFDNKISLKRKYDRLPNSSSEHGIELLIQEHESIQVQFEDKLSNALSIFNVDVISFDNQQLIFNVSFEISKGIKLLITGSSGCGKTTIVKALASLSGYQFVKSNNHDEKCPLINEAHVIFGYSRKDIIFVSQLPYCFKGTLAENIFYPKPVTKYIYSNPKDLTEVIRICGFEQFLQVREIDILNTEFDWTSLSPGMQQRIIFARIFFSNPKMVILDEATSSLDEISENDMYSKLVDRIETVISISHRSSIRQHHSSELQIKDKKAYYMKII